MRNAVILLVQNGLTPGGRLAAEVRLPCAPVPQLRIGYAGSCRVESVRYVPQDDQYVCRCVLLWPAEKNPKTLEELVAMVSLDTGLGWEHEEVADA